MIPRLSASKSAYFRKADSDPLGRRRFRPCEDCAANFLLVAHTGRHYCIIDEYTVILLVSRCFPWAQSCSVRQFDQERDNGDREVFLIYSPIAGIPRAEGKVAVIRRRLPNFVAADPHYWVACKRITVGVLRRPSSQCTGKHEALGTIELALLDNALG